MATNYTRKLGVITSFYRKLPNYNFAAVGVGGLKLVAYTLFTIITIEQAPQHNVALLMQLGVDGVFVGSKCDNTDKRALAMVQVGYIMKGVARQ